MKYFKLLILLLLIPLTVWAVATTITGAGNWSDSGNWAGGDIGNAITDDGTMNNNLGTITIQNAESFTIGSFDMGNGNTLTIDDGGGLIVGSMSTSGDLVVGNVATINANGNLEIWGNLNINNSLVLIVGMNGTVTIHGDILLGNNSVLDIQGDLTVDGNFTAGNDTDFTVDGQVNVGGNFSVGNGSVLDGTGNVNVTGTCSDSGTNICGQSQLPIVLLSFKVFAKIDFVLLEWATASEENFDFFSIQRSPDAREFEEIGKVNGSGFSTSIINYSFEDDDPIIGQSYYRLKAVDFDGTFEIFSLEQVEYYGDFNSFKIYPNPLTQSLLTVESYVRDEIQELVIFDFYGRKVIDQRLSLGKNEIDIGPGLNPGVYILKVFRGQEVYYFKLLLQ